MADDAHRWGATQGDPARITIIADPNDPRPKRTRDVVVASLIGTTIEYYDFLVYGLAASLVFGPQFFPGFDPVAGTLASLGTFGAGFLARPLGAILFGHFGDRFGRKRLLVASFLTAGGATFLIGVLPTFAQIGAAAPALLVLCRLVQGLGFGGEWGGAVLIAVEHAPPGRRIVYGSLTQMGNPAGLILATVVIIACNSSLTPEEFQAWGWRIPFLLSATLVVVGLVVRARLEESPDFNKLRRSNQVVRFPFGQLVRGHARELLVGTLAVTASPAVGLLLYVYLVSYGQRVLKLPTNTMLLLSAIAGLALLLSIAASARISERVGARPVSVVGLVCVAAWSVPFFALFDSRSLPAMIIAFAVFGVTVGIVNGPQATLLANLFPVGVRYSGASFCLQFSSVLGGVIAPAASTALLAATGTSMSIGIWVVVIAAVSLVAICKLRIGAGVEPDARTRFELAR
jgi:MFS family permease